jgi:hypothetical protein
MSRKGMTFVTLMLMMAVAALFLRFAIEQLIWWNLAQDEANAKETLRMISTAVENYAKDHMGAYPVNLSALYESKPVYIEKAYVRM